MNDNLIPRQPKRKRQPTAACMREQLVLAADRIIELTKENQALRAAFHAPFESQSRLDAQMPKVQGIRPLIRRYFGWLA